MLCDNEQLCCQSALDLSTCVVLHVTYDTQTHTHQQIFAVPLAESPDILRYSVPPPSVFVRVLCSSSDKPSGEVVCSSLRAVLSAHRFTWRCSTNYLMHAGHPTWAAAHRTGVESVCSHQVASPHVSG